MMCSSGEHSIMCRGGVGGWGGGMRGISQKHESEVNYSSVIVFEEGWGSGFTARIISNFLIPTLCACRSEESKTVNDKFTISER